MRRIAVSVSADGIEKKPIGADIFVVVVVAVAAVWPTRSQ